MKTPAISTSSEIVANRPDGRALIAYMLQAQGGLKVVILNYGGIFHELWVSGRDGERSDVILGQAEPTLYLEENDVYFGALRVGWLRVLGCWALKPLKGHNRSAFGGRPEHGANPPKPAAPP